MSTNVHRMEKLGYPSTRLWTVFHMMMLTDKMHRKRRYRSEAESSTNYWGEREVVTSQQGCIYQSNVTSDVSPRSARFKSPVFPVRLNKSSMVLQHPTHEIAMETTISCHRYRGSNRTQSFIASGVGTAKVELRKPKHIRSIRNMQRYRIVGSEWDMLLE